jgi:hypothetical protein
VKKNRYAENFYYPNWKISEIDDVFKMKENYKIPFEKDFKNINKELEKIFNKFFEIDIWTKTSRVKLFGPIPRYIFDSSINLIFLFDNFCQGIINKRKLSEMIPKENESNVRDDENVRHRFFKIVGDDSLRKYHLEFISPYIENAIYLKFLCYTEEDYIRTLLDCNFSQNWGCVGRVFEQFSIFLIQQKKKTFECFKYNDNGTLGNKRYEFRFKVKNTAIYRNCVFTNNNFGKDDNGILYIEDFGSRSALYDAVYVVDINKDNINSYEGGSNNSNSSNSSNSNSSNYSDIDNNNNNNNNNNNCCLCIFQFTTSRTHRITAIPPINIIEDILENFENNRKNSDKNEKKETTEKNEEIISSKERGRGAGRGAGRGTGRGAGRGTGRRGGGVKKLIVKEKRAKFFWVISGKPSDFNPKQITNYTKHFDCYVLSFFDIINSKK